MKTIAIIPIRGGSQRIPDKNIKAIAGKSLVCWSIDAALKSNVDEVWINTESDKYIKGLKAKYSDTINVYQRPSVLATNCATTDDVLLDFAWHYDDFDTMVVLQCTNPMTTEKDINNSIELFEKAERPVLSVVNVGVKYIWHESGTPKSYEWDKRPFTQGQCDTFLENGALFVCERYQLIETKCRIGPTCALYQMPRNTLYDIDTMEDWNCVEQELISREISIQKDHAAEIQGNPSSCRSNY